MRTDDLIDVLSADLAPVDHRRTSRWLSFAIAAGILVVIAIVFGVLGPRPDVTNVASWIPALFKIATTAVVLIPASVYLIRLSRPGGEHGASLALVLLPFAAVITLASLSIAAGSSEHARLALFSDEWIECIVSIPLIAIVPFAVITWVVRQMAPTDLARTGAFVGLVAGCISAIGYAFHCANDTVPFFAVWYGGTIALCTFAGWKLGPKLLRW
jgi:hypothetical protein